jgi:hypothetical protein
MARRRRVVVMAAEAPPPHLPFGHLLPVGEKAQRMARVERDRPGPGAPTNAPAKAVPPRRLLLLKSWLMSAQARFTQPCSDVRRPPAISFCLIRIRACSSGERSR